ncbi:MAG: carboxypeptidase regulatory-like domain-containing protein [Caldilineaceae bacterium]|nr:carboxypeptidase regulatory-like domain-containing protein [Caldilineaceae bacterium]
MTTRNRFVRWLTGDPEDDDLPVLPSSLGRQQGNDRTLSTALPPVENNTIPYDVTIEEAKVTPGAEYWRAIRIYHLAPYENNGRHHIFLDALSPEGVRVRNSEAHITWEGGQQTVVLDKPDNEPGANFPMWKWQICSVRMLGMPSDTVHGLRTNHADEPNPDGSASGNTLFHHSFLIEFQKVRAPETLGTILGRVENSREKLTVDLLREGNRIDSAPVNADGSFTFAALQPGNYEIRLEDKRQSVVVSGGQTAEVVITLSPRNSIIEGAIENGSGMLLRLRFEGNVLAEGTLGKSGTFRLRNLGAGNYILQVLRPQSNEIVVQSAPLTLDGTNQRRVDLTVPVDVPAPKASLDHYVLLGAVDQPSTRTFLTLLAPILAEKRLLFGFDMHEAAHAARVTIIGDGHTVPEFVLIYLTTHAVKVERLAGTPEEIRARLREL